MTTCYDDEPKYIPAAVTVSEVSVTGWRMVRELSTLYRFNDKLHRLTERYSTLAHYFALFGGLGLRLGYLTSSGAKSDVIYSCSATPIFYKGDEISRNFRQTKDAATETEGSHKTRHGFYYVAA